MIVALTMDQSRRMILAGLTWHELPLQSALHAAVSPFMYPSQSEVESRDRKRNREESVNRN